MSASHDNNYTIRQRTRARNRIQLVPCAECGSRFVELIGEQLVASCTDCGRLYQLIDGVQTTVGHCEASPVRVYYDPSVRRT